MKKLYHPLLLLLAVWLCACDGDEITTDVSVYTEEIVFTSAETVVMTGRVLAVGEVAVEDHGFQVSTDEGFASPATISLGEKPIPGRFVGQTSTLDPRTDYYCRGYITIGGETTVGNVLRFSTFSPKAVDFSPKEGAANTRITFEGVNLTSDAYILWDGMKIIPEGVLAESLIEFRAPAMQDKPSVHFQVVSKGDTLNLDKPFEYIIGKWEQVVLVDDGARNRRHVYFDDGDEFIYGYGYSLQYLSSVFKILDKNTYQLSTINCPCTPAEGAFFDKKYFGGGSVDRVLSQSQLPSNHKEFWKYDNQSFTRLADAPAALYKAVALLADNKLYLYGGITNFGEKNPVHYVYDIATDIWSNGFSSPDTFLNSYPAFHLDGFNYLVSPAGVTYRHHYTNGTWEVVAPLISAPVEYGYSLVLDGKAYVGLMGREKRNFMYRPVEDEWRTKTSLSENAAFETVGAWTHNGLIYVMRVNTASFDVRPVWEFDPNSF